jgi:hypothetical protein
MDLQVYNAYDLSEYSYYHPLIAFATITIIAAIMVIDYLTFKLQIYDEMKNHKNKSNLAVLELESCIITMDDKMHTLETSMKKLLFDSLYVVNNELENINNKIAENQSNVFNELESIQNGVSDDIEENRNSISHNISSIRSEIVELIQELMGDTKAQIDDEAREIKCDLMDKIDNVQEFIDKKINEKSALDKKIACEMYWYLYKAGRIDCCLSDTVRGFFAHFYGFSYDLGNYHPLFAEFCPVFENSHPYYLRRNGNSDESTWDNLLQMGGSK